MNSGHMLVSELTIGRDSVETPAVRHGPVKSGTVFLSRGLNIFFLYQRKNLQLRHRKDSFIQIWKESGGLAYSSKAARGFFIFSFFIYFEGICDSMKERNSQGKGYQSALALTGVGLEIIREKLNAY